MNPRTREWRRKQKEKRKNNYKKKPKHKKGLKNDNKESEYKWR